MALLLSIPFPFILNISVIPRDTFWTSNNLFQGRKRRASGEFDTRYLFGVMEKSHSMGTSLGYFNFFTMPSSSLASVPIKLEKDIDMKNESKKVFFFYKKFDCKNLKENDK